MTEKRKENKKIKNTVGEDARRERKEKYIKTVSINNINVCLWRFFLFTFFVILLHSICALLHAVLCSAYLLAALPFFRPPYTALPPCYTLSIWRTHHVFSWYTYSFTHTYSSIYRFMACACGTKVFDSQKFIFAIAYFWVLCLWVCFFFLFFSSLAASRSVFESLCYHSVGKYFTTTTYKKEVCMCA